MLEMFSQAGIVAKLSLIVSVAPMVMGVVYAFRPTESRLALMRPLSLAGLFAGLCGTSTGLVNVLRSIAMSGPTGARPDHVYMGLSEASVALVVSFGCLTVGWLSVALGMTRQH